jgi:hypothetical protein
MFSVGFTQLNGPQAPDGALVAALTLDPVEEQNGVA